MERKNEPTPPDRRAFLKKAGACVLGGASVLGPAAAGLVVFCDPLRRQGHASEMIHVASLNALPADGAPRKFPVITSHQDAWNRFPHVPVGAVYLRRTGEQTVQALNVVCPHAGCFVDFKADAQGYFCPCHNSLFALDGRISDPNSPAARGLDELPVEIRNGTEVWVKFQNFRAGTAEKIPLA